MEFSRKFSRTFRSLQAAFTHHSGSIKGSVPIPADAACAQTSPLLARNCARPQTAAPRDFMTKPFNTGSGYSGIWTLAFAFIRAQSQDVTSRGGAACLLRSLCFF